MRDIIQFQSKLEFVPRWKQSSIQRIELWMKDYDLNLTTFLRKQAVCEKIVILSTRAWDQKQFDYC